MKRILHKKILLPSILAITTLSLSALHTTSAADAELRNIITSKGLTGNAMLGRVIPNIADPKPQLGMRLFFSKSLGGDRDSACVTCHHPTLGGGDDLSLPVGVGAISPNLLGPGRIHSTTAPHHDGGPPVPRNAPTTFNIAGWDSVLFHDGRVESVAKTPNANGADGSGIRNPDSPFGVPNAIAGANLVAAQARFPVTSPEEMKGFNHNDKDNQGIRDFLASRIGGYGAGAGQLSNTTYWLTKFRAAFANQAGAAQELIPVQNLINEQNIAIAIGEYERSQSFTNTPWKSYIEGNNDAISATAKNGALLFFRSSAEGGANCSSCHSGDLFTDEGFHNIAMPQIGRGKGDGADGSDDFGRFRESGVEDDRYAFRTPTLLNVAETGPWSHAGSYTSLTATVKHHLNPATAVASYDFGQLSQAGIQHLDKLSANTQKALDKLAADRNAGKNVLQNINLSDAQVAEVVAFLHTLTDPCIEDRNCISQWIPPAGEDPNGDQLDAVGSNGASL